MTDLDCRVLAAISERGFHVITVSGEDETPSFSYSVGLKVGCEQPDVIVIGLGIQLGGFVVEEYCRRVTAGERFVPGGRYPGFLDRFKVSFERVARSHYDEYLRFNAWGYAGMESDALQLVYPNTSGVWPWDKQADAWFRSYQPILTADGVPCANAEASIDTHPQQLSAAPPHLVVVRSPLR